MKVKAIARGFDGSTIREPGEVFEFEGKLGKWMLSLEVKETEQPVTAHGRAKAVKHEEPGRAARKSASDSDVI